MADFIVVLTIVTSAVTLWGGLLQALDYRMTRLVARAVVFPIKIRRSVSYANYLRAVDQLRQVIDARRLVPDIVVGVHYGGLGPAAEIAKVWRRPVRQVEVRVGHVGGEPVCEAVTPKFDLTELAGQVILVVDNRIRSGRTLERVVALLRPHARDVRTCVIHKPTPYAGNFHEPDFVLFESSHPLKNLLK